MTTSYQGCPHGRPHEEPCPECTAIWRAHCDRQNARAELERMQREMDAKVRMKWRAGSSLGRTLYLDDACVGMLDTRELALTVIAAMNGNNVVEREALRTENERLRPIVDATVAWVEDMGECHFCGFDADSPTPVHDTDCPLRLLELPSASTPTSSTIDAEDGASAKDECTCGHPREHHDRDDGSCDYGAHGWACGCASFVLRRERDLAHDEGRAGSVSAREGRDGVGASSDRGGGTQAGDPVREVRRDGRAGALDHVPGAEGAVVAPSPYAGPTSYTVTGEEFVWLMCGVSERMRIVCEAARVVLIDADDLAGNDQIQNVRVASLDALRTALKGADDAAAHAKNMVATHAPSPRPSRDRKCRSRSCSGDDCLGCAWLASVDDEVKRRLAMDRPPLMLKCQLCENMTDLIEPLGPVCAGCRAEAPSPRPSQEPDWRDHYARVASALGITYDCEGQGSWPGPIDAVLAQIEGLKAAQNELIDRDLADGCLACDIGSDGSGACDPSHSFAKNCTQRAGPSSGEAVIDLARKVVEAETRLRREIHPGTPAWRRSELSAARSHWIDRLDAALGPGQPGDAT